MGFGEYGVCPSRDTQQEMNPASSSASVAAPLDVVREEPLCAETPREVLQQAVTPRESVYVRSNFPTPSLDASHVIVVRGAVQHPYEVAVHELAAWPQHEVLVTMECAGNWRLGMDPVPVGEPWSYGAVSTTAWRGVRVADLLTRAGIAPEAVELLTIGADKGERDDSVTPGPVTFARGLPVDAAMHPDTILATHMDGEPLTQHHGAPARLIVPGWYGMASVKWVAAFELITTPFDGYFQRQRYVYKTAEGDTPVTRALVKSFLAKPERSADGRVLTARGWAWSGFGEIARVQVQVNAGEWVDAELIPSTSPYAWTGFSLVLDIPAGPVTVRTRATDTAGNTQPDRIEWNSLGYGNNAVRTFVID
ncbi:MAG: molybdopterin-dependent oxidoreductase [Gemmatimonadaceae bacterium]|nr:molybdopterin-dependent oxidoreductase [Gemmatimonadaceae bacterium]